MFVESVVGISFVKLLCFLCCNVCYYGAKYEVTFFFYYVVKW